MNLAHHYRTLGLRRSASFGEVKKAYRQLVRQCHPDIHPGQAATDRFIQITTAYTALCEALQVPEEDTQPNFQQNTPTANGSNSAGKPSQPERLNLKELKRTLEKLGLGNFSQDNFKPKNGRSASSNTGTQSQSAQSQSAQAQNTQAQNTQPTVSANGSGVSESPSATSENSIADTSNPSKETSEADTVIKKEAYDQLKDLLRQQKFPRAIALVEGLAHRLPADTEINQWQAIVYQRWGRQLISQGQFHKAHLYLKKALQTDPNNPSLGNEVARDLGLLKHIRAAETTLSQP
ncbi:MAG: DnaJ domain-containing protein [Cyanobacteria bacterium J06629_19]